MDFEKYKEKYGPAFWNRNARMIEKYYNNINMYGLRGGRIDAKQATEMTERLKKEYHARYDAFEKSQKDEIRTYLESFMNKNKLANETNQMWMARLKVNWQKIDALVDTFNRKADETDEEWSKRKIKAIEDFGFAEGKLTNSSKQKLLDLETKYNKLNADEYKAYTEEVHKIWSEELAYREASRAFFIQGFSDVANMGFDIVREQAAANYDTEMYYFNKAIDDKKAALELEKNNGLKTETEYQQALAVLEQEKLDRELKQKIKIAKFEKESALYQLAIQTSLNIVKALGDPALIRAISVASAVMTGMVQAAIINSKPLPTYKTGGFVAGVGSGTEDNITARISAGESIINAKSTEMFRPLLSSINVAGGGASFSDINVPINANSGMNRAEIRAIVQEIASIPVNNVATETDKMTRKVKNIENKARF
jgi:hypothetical protein